MTKVREQASNAAAMADLARLEWSPLSRPEAIRYGPAMQPGAVVTADYSKAGAGADIAALSHDLAGASHDASFAYAYHGDHRLKSQTVTGANPGWRPSSPTGPSRSYLPDRLNRYVQVGGATGASPQLWSHDANGNVTSDGGTSFAYDPENRMISSLGRYTSEYVSDPLGRRVRKSVRDPFAGDVLVSDVSYHLDGDEEIAEWSGGALVRRFVPGPQIDRPIAMVMADGGKRYFHQDRLGSMSQPPHPAPPALHRPIGR